MTTAFKRNDTATDTNTETSKTEFITKENNMKKKLYRDMTEIEQIAFTRAQTKATNEAFLNNVLVAQRVEQKNEDVKDQAVRSFLTGFYAECNDPAHLAAATLFKAAIKQRLAFIATSQDSLIEALKNDPDNTLEIHHFLKTQSAKDVEEGKKPSAKLSRITAGLASHGIIQLWNSNRFGKSPAFVIVHPIVLELLNLDSNALTKQYRALQAFCNNYSIPEDWIFNSVGEMRVEIGKITDKVKEIKNNKSPSTKEKSASTDDIIVKPVAGILNAQNEADLEKPTVQPPIKQVKRFGFKGTQMPADSTKNPENYFSLLYKNLTKNLCPRTLKYYHSNYVGDELKSRIIEYSTYFIKQSLPSDKKISNAEFDKAIVQFLKSKELDGFKYENLKSALCEAGSSAGLISPEGIDSDLIETSVLGQNLEEEA